MKIDITKLADGGRIALKQRCSPQFLDLDAPNVKFSGFIGLEGRVEKKNNAVIIKADLALPLIITCSRCLKEFSSDLRRQVMFDYSVGRNETAIDVTEDLRSEIILDYPLNPLCQLGCKGLCARCGEDLNEEKCKCKIKPKLTDSGKISEKRKFDG